MATNITLANTITWARSFIANLDPTVMTGSEPALTCANIIKQIIMGPPMTWRWNRATTGFITAAGVQDYLLYGSWVANTAIPVNAFLIDSNGNSQQVTTAGTSSTVQPTWATGTGVSTTDGTVTWKNLGPIAGASSSYTFNFIETASVQDIVLSSPKWFEMSPNICLGIDSTLARPREIAAQKDDNAGNITFRLMPVPDRAYPVAITVQQRPSLFVTPADKWAPIPDEYSYIYNWGFLALMFMYNDDPRWAVANQKFVGSLLGAQQGLTETERNIFLNNWEALSGQQAQNTIKMQQGNQARGV